MKILMLLSNPFTHDARVYNEAKALLEAGHEVTIIAWDRKSEHPIEDAGEGIRVLRIRNTAYMNLLPYDIFRMRPFWRQLAKKAVELHKEWEFDAVHCHDLDTLPAGVKLKKRLGIKLIYDAHEIWGYMVQKDLPEWWVNRFLRLEKNIAPEADHIITVSEPLEEYFRDMGCKNVTLVRNCKPLEKQDYQPTDNEVFTLLYIGGLNNGRFLIEAMEICKDMDGVRFIVGGFGSLESQVQKCSKNANNIEYKGRIPMSEVLAHTQKADAIHCVFDPTNKNNAGGLPNKIFEAMTCGRPIICTKGIYSGNVVGKYEMGITVEYDKASYKQAIMELRDSPDIREKLGRNALEAAKGEFNWERQEERLVGVYGDVALHWT